MNGRRTVSREEITLLALHKQHLLDDTQTDDVVQTIADAGGLHAQVPATPYLSLNARMQRFRRGQLDAELYTKRSLARIRSIRQTVYIFSKSLLPAAFCATRRMMDFPPEKYSRHLGMSRETYDALAGRIQDLLRGRGLTVPEIGKELGSPPGLSLAVNHLCDQGLLLRDQARSGWRSSQHTYRLFAEIFPDLDLHGLGEAEARQDMVALYLRSFGAVTEADISWWTGFPKGEIRGILARMGEKILRLSGPDLGGEHLLLRQDGPLLGSLPRPRGLGIRFLPALDPYLMGFRDRDRLLDSGDSGRVFDASGNAAPTVLSHGRVIGVWDLEREPEPRMKVLLFNQPGGGLPGEVAAEAARTARFCLDRDAPVLPCTQMTPLRERTAGGFLTPLKLSGEG